MAAKHRRMIKRAAKKHGIKPKILYGLWGAETNFAERNAPSSSAGAQGPFQFMPATARSYGINPHKFGQAADAAAKYLATYKGRGLEGMLRAYNAGPAGSDNPQSRAHYANTVRFSKRWEDPGGGKGKGGKAPARRKGTPARVVSKTRTIPGVDNSSLRTAAKLEYLRNRGKPGALLDLKSSLGDAKDVPSRTTTDYRVKHGRKAPARKGKDDGKPGRVQGGGGFGDTEMIVKNAVKGLPVSNFKRSPAQNAAVGGSKTSDHLTTNRSSYAADVPFGSGRKLAKRLGIKNWKPGTYTRYTITGKGGKKYSVQLLEKVEGHYDHTHLGVRAL